MKSYEKIALGSLALLFVVPPAKVLPPFTKPVAKSGAPTSKGSGVNLGAVGENDMIQYQTDAATGLVLITTDGDVAWSYPKLKEDKVSQFRTMVLKWSDLADSVGHDLNVPSSTIFGVMWAESQGNPNAKSSAGALGLMQVMPQNFPPGTSQATMVDPHTNMTAGVRLLRAANGRPLPEVASWYNAGGKDGAPWTNEAWLKSGRKASQTSRWGVASEPGYIDRVVAASNTYLLIQGGQA